MSKHPVAVEYIWISGADAHHDIRSKIKCLHSDTPQQIKLEDLPEWNFDGSSTGQAEAGGDTEILIRPVALFPHPFIKGVPAYAVLCECFYPDGTPTVDNHRFIARGIFDHPSAKGLDPWFGMEQEYVLMKNHRPYGWPPQGFPAPQGPYYCANGPYAYGRHFANRHLEACLQMGLQISGSNAEVMPGQWEYQVGPAKGIQVGDHMTMARWVFLRIVEEASVTEPGLDVNFDVKPIKGDWNGSGMHTNFSTAEMRREGGIDAIMKALDNMKGTMAKDVRVYSVHNNERLTGQHETSKLSEFSFGVGTRHTSCRIPNQVNKEKKGYFEDRRPGADSDPYLVSARIFASACGIPDGAMTEVHQKLRQDWMPRTEQSFAQFS